MKTLRMQDEIFANEMIPEEENPQVAIICDDKGSIAWIGKFGVTKIELYNECGQMGYVPWAAVYTGDFLYARIDLAGKRIYYKKPEISDNIT